MKYTLLVFVSSLVCFGIEAKTYIDESEIPELAYINASVDPCDDFYEYVCGNFKNVHSIPSNKIYIDQFSLLEAELTNVVTKILSSNTLDDDPVSLKKAKAAYKACIDTDSIDWLYLSNPELELVENVGGFPLVESTQRSTQFGWYDIGDLIADYGVPLMFSISSSSDPSNSSRMLLQISKDPIGIPQEIRQSDPSYDDLITEGLYDFVKQKEISTFSNASTLLPMDKLLRFLSLKIKTATGSGASEDQIYTTLANVTNFMRGIYAGGVVPDGTIDAFPNLSFTLKELNEWTEKYFGDSVELDWIEFLSRVFKNTGVAVTEDMRVSTTSNLHLTLAGVINWVKMNDPAIVKSMAMLRIFLYMSPDSDAETREAFQSYLEAIGKPTYPRREYCARKITDATTTASLSFALAYEYQLRYFNVNKLSKAVQMVRDVQQSFREVVSDEEWMDDTSRAAALQKVDNVAILLGYPDFVEDKTSLDKFYENVRICRWDNYGNSKRLRAFQLAYQIDQMRSRDRTVWANSPFTVNAYYNRLNNRIILPMAMLHPVFFGTNSSVLDYSRMGSIIGHEITHGFDNTGRYYDENGIITNWWSDETYTAFSNKTSCFTEQYSNYYIPEIEQYVNGTTTLNENIADNGGTRNSYKALQKLLERYSNDTVPRTKDYDVDQLFFIGFGTMWCSSESLEYLQASQTCVGSSCHARSKWRVNGVVSNMEEFSKAFSCPSGSKMNPEEKCRLW